MEQSAYIWDTWAYLGSCGSTVRKSAFVGSTLLHLAVANIFFSVPKRFLSLSNAYS